MVCRDSALSLKMSFGAWNKSKHFTDCDCSSGNLILSQKSGKEPSLVLALFFFFLVLEVGTLFFFFFFAIW